MPTTPGQLLIDCIAAIEKLKTWVYHAPATIDSTSENEVTETTHTHKLEITLSFTYLAYASDDTGTDFTLTNDTALAYMAVLVSPIEIVTPVVGDFAGLWRSSGVLIGDWIEDIAFEFCDVVAGTAKDYILDISATFAYNILSCFLETDNGTLTGVAVKIGTTAVTSISSVTVDTTVDETTATGANSVAIGNRVKLSVSTGYSGTPTLIRGKLKIQRT